MAKQYLLASAAGLKQLTGRCAANWRLSDDRDRTSNIFEFGYLRGHQHRLDAARDSAEPPQRVARQGSSIVIDLIDRGPLRSFSAVRGSRRS